MVTLFAIFQPFRRRAKTLALYCSETRAKTGAGVQFGQAECSRFRIRFS